MHRALAGDEDAPYPFNLWLATLLEAFPGRLPSEILAEVHRLPAGYLEQLLEVKAYMQAYHMTEAADTAEARTRLPTTPLFQLVNEINEDLAEEWKRRNE